MAKEACIMDNRKFLAAVATLGPELLGQVKSRFNGSLQTQGGCFSASKFVSDLLKQMPDHERQAMCVASRVIG